MFCGYVVSCDVLWVCSVLCSGSSGLRKTGHVVQRWVEKRQGLKFGESSFLVCSAVDW
jgi:hypothetical protein